MDMQESIELQRIIVMLILNRNGIVRSLKGQNVKMSEGHNVIRKNKSCWRDILGFK